uniref:HTH CENPB-type domain-containing protein n=1 Tax=Acanthochromis polyacanthus TaxID=80966 RepID=A0A3Q1FM46_9TELE
MENGKEKILVLCLEDQQQHRVPVSLKLIQEKAKRRESEEFESSKGWFLQFKTHADFHEFCSQPENPPGEYPPSVHDLKVNTNGLGSMTITQRTQRGPSVSGSKRTKSSIWSGLVKVQT